MKTIINNNEHGWEVIESLIITYGVAITGVYGQNNLNSQRVADETLRKISKTMNQTILQEVSEAIFKDRHDEVVEKIHTNIKDQLLSMLRKKLLENRDTDEYKKGMTYAMHVLLTGISPITTI